MGAKIAQPNVFFKPKRNGPGDTENGAGAGDMEKRSWRHCITKPKTRWSSASASGRVRTGARGKTGVSNIFVKPDLRLKIIR